MRTGRDRKATNTLGQLLITFDDDQVDQVTTTSWLHNMVAENDFYKTGISKFVSRLTKCINVNADYIK